MAYKFMPVIDIFVLSLECLYAGTVDRDVDSECIPMTDTFITFSLVFFYTGTVKDARNDWQ